jgi:hypothetical protein
MLPATIQNDFVALKKGYGPVKSYSAHSLELAMKDVLTVASFEAGQNMADNPTVLYAQTQALCSELKGRYGELTLPEVQSAFKRGIRGDFGPWFGFCSKTYHQFLKGFFDLPDRGKAWLAYLESEELKKIQSDKPVQMDERWWISECKRTFSEYKRLRGNERDEDRVFFTLGAAAAIYDKINERIGVEYEHPKHGKIKTLVPDVEIRGMIATVAEEIYEHEKKALKKQGKLSSTDEILQYDKSGRTRGNILKKHYLIYFFDELIKNQKDLEL